MNLTRNLILLDVESSGLDTNADRIVSLAMVKLYPEGDTSKLEIFANPGIRIRPEVTSIHGISNEQAATFKTFKEQAQEVHQYLQQSDLAGYNCVNFDIPIIWEELYRAGIEWDLTGIKIVDVGNIFKKKEPRDLSTAVQYYCGKPHTGAHTALADTLATQEVLNAQLDRYEELRNMTVAELSAFSNMDKLPRVDLAGNIRLNSEGEYVYGLKSKAGVRIKDDPGFGNWMLQKSFPINTKIHLSKILRSFHKEKLF